MESIAVTKPGMGVLSQERLLLSPFGALAQAFSQEILDRARKEEGRWSYVPLDLLEPFRTQVEGWLGEGSCHVLNIRNYGAVPVTPEL